MISSPTGRKSLFFLTVFLVVLTVTSAMIYLHSSPRLEAVDVLHYLSGLLRKPSSPFFFIAAMIILPPFGFPISFFLALAGIRFGILDGMILTFLVLPLHMTICYAITRTFLRGPLTRFLARKGYKIPFLQTRRPGLAMFGFMVMPGPPYTLKTYLLAMTDLPYHRFLIFNWITESLVTLPIVAMTGAAAEKNWVLLGLALFVFGLSLSLRWYQKKKETSMGK
ncbi:MAG: TVP38/TMEM64 family protein [Desulfurivibrionaceae bacterium]